MNITVKASGPRSITVTENGRSWTWTYPLNADGTAAPAYMDGPDIRDLKQFDRLQRTADGLARDVGLIPNPEDDVPPP